MNEAMLVIGALFVFVGASAIIAGVTILYTAVIP
jgi:hypothetical protein